jgi:hypothetical protein
MATKDFSILLEKVNTRATAKDISLVSGYNAYSQYIENVCKTQKGELVADINFGSDYFNYIFAGQADIGSLEAALAAYIEASITSITNVVVKTQNVTDTVFEFFITYSISDGINAQNNASTLIEVEI